jgi:two-component system chemotaxis response regulator CheB
MEAVVIGVSAGGFNALHTLLPALPPNFRAAVIIVQHRLSSSQSFLEESLAAKCCLRVKAAEEKEKIQPSIIYFCPPDYHLLVESDKTFSFSSDAPVNYSRPSIDVLFESAAEVYGSSLAGIILTGANSDGSRGISRIKELGGITLAQSPEEAEADYMPKAAIATKKIDFIMHLADMPDFLISIAGGTDETA